MACAVSKYYNDSSVRYWYAYHPSWDAFLGEAETAFFTLGCMDIEFAFAIPFATIHAVVDGLNLTQLEDKLYWHIHLRETQDGIVLLLPKRQSQLNLEPFRIALLK
jgi:hypothetical protein